MSQRYFFGRNEHGLRSILRYEKDHLDEVFAKDQFGTHDYASAASDFSYEIGRAPTIKKIRLAWNDYVRNKGFLNEIIHDLGEMQVPPGHRIPRIARATHAHPSDPPVPNAVSPREKSELQQGKAELATILSRLRRICRTVHPEGDNLEAYGIEISELHVISCIGVEGHFKSILSANGYGKSRLTTRDFVKVLKPTRLDEYQFEFLNYPWLNFVAPFIGWDAKKPTSSLEWYDRYNRAKHDPYRRTDGPRLKHVFESVCASAALMIAQYGDRSVRGTIPEIFGVLHPTSYPKWENSELYTNVPNREWKSFRYTF